MGQQTEEINLNAPETPPTMNNHPYNQIPGFPYATQYGYNYPPPYNPVPPYPAAAPYGMPAPMPLAPNMPNYSYYAPIPAPQDPLAPYVPNPPLYTPTIPYSQTRMASPTPYVGYPPPQPTYNYNTTNMISRPTRPVSLYPQLSQMHSYPPMPPNSANMVQNVTQSNTQRAVKTEPSRDSVESNSSRKSSEVSVGVSYLNLKEDILFTEAYIIANACHAAVPLTGICISYLA